MDNLNMKIKEIFIQNKLSILSLLVFSVLMDLETSLMDFNTYNNNFIGIITIMFILTGLAYFINEIIIIKKYVTNKLNNFPNIEYNNYKIIILQAFKIFILYFLLALILIIIAFIFCIIIDANIISIFTNADFLNEENYNLLIDMVINSKILSFFILFIIPLLLFFKLLFVEHILIFKQENYKIKNIINKSKSIIQTNKIFFFITYLGYYLFQFLVEEVYFKNNYIINILCDIIYVLLFLIYLISFSDIMKNDFIKIKENNNIK